MLFMKQGWKGGQRPRLLGLCGKMITCDVSQVVILGQEIAGSLLASRGALAGEGAGLN